MKPLNSTRYWARTPSVATLVVCGALVVVASAFAHGSPDQVNLPPSERSVFCGIGAGGMYQSFTPTRRLLASVELPMRTGAAFPATGTSAAITVRARTPSGPSVATASARIDPLPRFGSVTAHFDFVPPAVLEPEGVFVIEGSQGDVLAWVYRDDDPYAGGMMFGCVTGQPLARLDANFATFVPADAAPPETVIGTGPGETDGGSTVFGPAAPAFAFDGSDDLSYASRLRFECELDGAGFAPCGTSARFRVGDGRHRFAVRAVDEASQADPTPATRSWIVDTTPPARPLVRGPRRSAIRTVVYRFASSDRFTPVSRLAFRCAVDSRRLGPCRSPYRVRLAPGQHALRVAAVDLAGNVSGVTVARITVGG